MLELNISKKRMLTPEEDKGKMSLSVGARGRNKRKISAQRLDKTTCKNSRGVHCTWNIWSRSKHLEVVRATSVEGKVRDVRSTNRATLSHDIGRNILSVKYKWPEMFGENAQVSITYVTSRIQWMAWHDQFVHSIDMVASSSDKLVSIGSKLPYSPYTLCFAHWHNIFACFLHLFIHLKTSAYTHTLNIQKWNLHNTWLCAIASSLVFAHWHDTLTYSWSTHTLTLCSTQSHVNKFAHRHSFVHFINSRTSSYPPDTSTFTCVLYTSTCTFS